MIFPISKAKYAIIKNIYECKSISISELISKSRASRKKGYEYIGELLDAEIAEEKLEGKKPVLRFLKPKFSENGKNIFALIENDKAYSFFNKHQELKGAFFYFKNDIIKLNAVAIIFGSFARNAEDKESDIDILIIGKKKDKKAIEKIAGKCFITLKRRVSLRFTERAEFIKAIKNKDAFALQILKEHIVVANAREWVDMLENYN